jgi:zinc transporter 1/2/3
MGSHGSRWRIAIFLLTKCATSATHAALQNNINIMNAQSRKSRGPTSKLITCLSTRDDVCLVDNNKTQSSSSGGGRRGRKKKNSSINLNKVPRGGGGMQMGETVTMVSSAVTPYGIHLNVWKIIFQILLTTINVACWYIPLQSKSITNNKLALSLANAFSGGVFLSLAFGHLIPECVHGFHDAASVAVAAAGTTTGGTMTTQEAIVMNDALPYMIVLSGYLLIFFVEKVAFDADVIKKDMEGGGGKVIVVGEEDSSSSSSMGGFKIPSAVILLSALAIHSILEMTALGLADTFGDSALLTLSIALHQPAESVALLVAFLKSGMSQDQITKYLAIFSCMGPIGVGIGMVVKSFSSPFIDATMLAIVAGTFVYVGATEVIPEEWEDPEHKWKKFISLLLGIVTIFAITQYTMTLEGF